MHKRRRRLILRFVGDKWGCKHLPLYVLMAIINDKNRILKCTALLCSFKEKFFNLFTLNISNYFNSILIKQYQKLYFNRSGHRDYYIKLSSRNMTEISIHYSYFTNNFISYTSSAYYKIYTF